MSAAPPDPRVPLRILKVVWAVLLASLALYAAVPLAPPLADAPPGGAPPLFPPVLAGVAGVVAILTFVLRRRRIDGPASRGELDLRTPEGVQAYFTASLLIWVLSESIGVYGLVVWLLAKDPAWLRFLLAAAALLWHHRPGRSLPRASAADLARSDVRIG